MEIHPRNPHGFQDAAQFSHEYSRARCKHKGLEKIMGAFIRNMSRVRGIGLLPINFISITVVNESARMEALANLGIPFHDPRITRHHPNFDAELFDEVDAERKRLVEVWLQKAGTNRDKAVFDSGTYHLNVIIDSNQQDSWEAVQAALAAMVLGLWTAFESSMQDVWITAVNAHPKLLADRVLKTLDKEDQQKFLPGNIISDAGYDLRNCMGDILLRKRAVDFQRLKSLKRAYDIAFDNEFESIVSKHYAALEQLEAVRNLFAHKGGVIDERFRSKLKNPPEMEVGHIYCVTGRYVADQADTVSECSTALVTGVDDWLEKNQVVA